jgi:methionine aminotransferase
VASYAAISTENDVAFCKGITEYGVAAIPISTFMKTERDHHLIRFCFEKTTLLWKKRQNDYAKSNPMNFRF